MMNNAWKINEGDRSYGKGWANKDESPSKNPKDAAGGRSQGAGSKVTAP